MSDYAGRPALYHRIHYRQRRTFGKAAEWPCCWCKWPAADWARVHGTPDSNPLFQPMCRGCHQRYDRSRRTPDGLERMFRVVRDRIASRGGAS